jgi:hypothetical protein
MSVRTNSPIALLRKKRLLLIKNLHLLVKTNVCLKNISYCCCDALWSGRNLLLLCKNMLVEIYGHCGVTNYMEQSPSWEANGSSASQEIPCILWNLKVHYHIYKSPPRVPIRSQIDPDHAPHPTSILILSFHLRLCLPSGLHPYQTVYAPIVSPYVLHALPILFFLFDHSDNIWWGVQSIKLLVM